MLQPLSLLLLCSLALLAKAQLIPSRPSVLFMLSSLDVSGGNISILQEALEMRRRGMRVSIAVSKKYVSADYVSRIMGLSSRITAQEVDDMIVVYDGNCCWPKEPSDKLAQIAQNFDVVVATYHSTVAALEGIIRANPNILPAYYVQDYEPWFSCSPFDCPFRQKLTFYNRWYNKALVAMERRFNFSKSTYTAVDGKLFLFAKTDWIKNMVESRHKGTKVHIVVPSIDHASYFPNNESLRAKKALAKELSVKKRMTHHVPEEPSARKVKIVAMLRPRTSRRNTLGCLDTLLKIAHEHPHAAQVSFFGVEQNQLAELLLKLIEERGPAQYRSVNQVETLGLIRRRANVADLFQRSDLFVDMSWWQAFGRTAVEAMACGCVPVMPSLGASRYVCDNGRVCQYHDGTDSSGYYHVIVSLIYHHTERIKMMMAGLERVHEFSIRNAAESIEAVLIQGFVTYRNISRNGNGNY